jgi:hypothetical protein
MPVNVCVASRNRANKSRPLRPGGAVGATTAASEGADVVSAADAAADAAVGTVVAGPPAGEQPARIATRPNVSARTRDMERLLVSGWPERGGAYGGSLQHQRVGLVPEDREGAKGRKRSNWPKGAREMPKGAREMKTVTDPAKGASCLLFEHQASGRLAV